MKIIIFLILFLLQMDVICQRKITFSEPLEITAIEKVNSEIKKGTKILANEVGYVIIEGYTEIHIIGKNSENEFISFPYKKISSFSFDNIDKIEKIWDKNLLLNESYLNIIEKGQQYDLRNELNNDAVQYVNTLSISGSFFNDEYFEDYLYTILNKIHSGILKDDRPGNLYIKILKDIEPNAYALPNGCIIISTGLLSTIQSEDELVGILSHEVAHFVLDHQILNYNKEIDRRKRAEFWSAIATAAAATADIYLAANNKNYIPGALTTTAAIASTVISDEIINRLGIKYSQNQELEADIAAKEVLENLRYNKFGLSAALKRIKNYCILTGNYMALSGSGTHPSFEERIIKLGDPESLEAFIQPSFLKKVSMINSHNAWIELWFYAHQKAAIELAERNISVGLATESDLIVKAIVTRRTSNTSESNEQVLNLLNKAKSVNVNPILMLNKEIGITLLRLQKNLEAKQAFENYLKELTELKKNHITNQTNNIQYIEDEIIRTKKMIFKSDHL
jgi:predicted Zn-dependent protease